VRPLSGRRRTGAAEKGWRRCSGGSCNRSTPQVVGALRLSRHKQPQIALRSQIALRAMLWVLYASREAQHQESRFGAQGAAADERAGRR